MGLQWCALQYCVSDGNAAAEQKAASTAMAAAFLAAQ